MPNAMRNCKQAKDFASTAINVLLATKSLVLLWFFREKPALIAPRPIAGLAHPSSSIDCRSSAIRRTADHPLAASTQQLRQQSPPAACRWPASDTAQPKQ